MKKQKLHQLAKFAAVSLIGAIPFVGISEATAQQNNGLMPPIVQGVKASATSMAKQSYSYTSDASKPLVPTLVSSAKVVPPIITGKRIGTGVTTKPAIGSTTTGSSLLAPIGSGVKQVAFSPAKMPVRAQGSSSRSIAPLIGAQGSSSRIAAPPIQIQPPSAISPNSAPVISGSLVTQGPQSVLQSGPVVADPNYFDSAPLTDPIPMQSVVSGCSDCAGGGCDSCGQGGQGGPGGSYNPNQINCEYGTYGSVSSARRYAYLELLYLTREDGDITNSNFNPLGDFDFEAGWRVTLGQRSDMTQGREISYFGTAGIEESQTTNNAENRLNALFTPAGGLIPNDLSSFFNASQHIQFKETTIHSLEYNRVRWGWDVLKSFVGLRYIYLDDQYQLNSTAPTFFPGVNESGEYRIDTINHLLGGHIGAELFYDIGYRFSLSGVSKFGVYANINEVDNFLQNDGVTLLDTEDNDANISTTYELQFLAHYQIRQTASIAVGLQRHFSWKRSHCRPTTSVHSFRRSPDSIVTMKTMHLFTALRLASKSIDSVLRLTGLGLCQAQTLLDRFRHSVSKFRSLDWIKVGLDQFELHQIELA